MDIEDVALTTGDSFAAGKVWGAHLRQEGNSVQGRIRSQLTNKVEELFLM